MAEIKVKLSQTSQSFGGINISQTSQSIGAQISGTNTEIVPHDDTLKGSGSGSSPLGIADSVLQDIDNRVEKTNSADKVYGTGENGEQTLYDLDSFGKVDDVLVDGQSVVVNKVAEIDLSGKVNANAPIQAATHTKIQYDNKGLVTGGSDLTESDIPSLHLSKISDITATANEVNALDGITGNVQEQLNTKANSSDLATVATSGDYNDLSNTPTIGNGTLTVQKNNTTIDTFSANSTSDTTINIEVPTDTGDLTNGADYQTGTDVSGSISTHNESTTAHSNIITTINNNIGAIEEKIPSQATSSNQLADKAFVNSSIATNTANFIGTFNSVAELEAYSGTLTNNDYAFVIGTDTAGNTVYDRYKYTTSTTPASWVFEYELNNSSFTADQWAAINSGATTTNIGKAETAVQPSDLSTVATTGDYADLSNKPTIPAAQVNSDWNANSGVAQILNKPTLATVATSGSYADLSNKPTIPTVNNATLTIQKNGTTVNTFTANASSNVTANITVPTKTSDLTNDDGFITGITSGDVTTALGYTPVNPSTLATVATSGSYNDLSNKPTVGDGTITLTQGGTTKGTFTVNQSGNTTIDLDAGGSDYHPDLFDVKWADHICDDVQWLRSDTFSWQSGAVYEVAYQHLTGDITGKTLQSETIGSTTIQFYLADDGHKICPASEESNVTAIYNATGVAWYYIIDTTNQRFKLPRTKFGFTGLRDTVGNYVAPTLPNHAHNVTYRDAGVSGGPYSGVGGGSYFGNRTVTSSGVSNNSVYQDSATVQPPATQMYLYFYVGNFTQTALENTAGITTEPLNDKVDKGHEVIEFQAPTAANNYTWYRKYADGWVEQGGAEIASGTTIILPIAMADTKYTVQTTPTWGTAASSGTRGMASYSKTTTSFSAQLDNNSGSFDWQISGIAAS